MLNAREAGVAGGCGHQVHLRASEAPNDLPPCTNSGKKQCNVTVTIKEKTPAIGQAGVGASCLS